MRNPALVRRMETQWRLSRAWGLANVLAVHQLADFNAVGEAGSEARARASALLALTSTRVVYRQPADQLDTTAAAMGLNTTETSLLPTLPRGRHRDPPSAATDWRAGATTTAPQGLGRAHARSGRRTDADWKPEQCALLGYVPGRQVWL